MRFRIAFLMYFILAMAGSLAAQSRTVTNADLEKYKQARLKAEREYSENYARLGLPSPEEIERRREQDRIETEKLSAKLRADSLERDRLDVQREAQERAAAAVYYRYSQTEYAQAGQETPIYEPGYFWSYGRRYRRSARQNYYQQPGYFAGGQFWPTGPRTPPQHVFVRPQTPRR